MPWQRLDRAIVAATLALAVAGAGLLGALAAPGWPLAAAAVYAASLVCCTLASFLYHSLARSPRRALLRRLDHAAIFLLIAGTYTPLGLVALRGEDGAWLVGAVWTMALAGLVLKLVLGPAREALFIAFYVALGWTALVDASTLLRALDGATLALLVGGGLAFSLGALVHWRGGGAWAQPAWHALVLLGCATHYGAVVAIV